MSTHGSGGKGALSSADVASALAPFGVRLTEDQIASLRRYVEVLLLWNQKLSLTALDDPLGIVARHFGESIFGGQIVGFERGRLADVGTGGGFPGLPLKIAFPELEVTLIEANSKKCAFLREVVQQLDLKGVRVFRGPYAEFSTGDSKFDFICSRALGDYRNLLNWAAPALSPHGRVVMWLGQDDSIRLGRIDSWIWDLPVRIPESQRRVLMVGRLKSGLLRQSDD